MGRGVVREAMNLQRVQVHQYSGLMAEMLVGLGHKSHNPFSGSGDKVNEEVGLGRTNQIYYGFWDLIPFRMRSLDPRGQQASGGCKQKDGPRCKAPGPGTNSPGRELRLLNKEL